MHYSELKINIAAYHFLIFTLESRPPITVFFLLYTSSINLQVIEGIIRALLQKQRHHRHMRRAEHQAFFSDREKLQNRHDRQLLLEILIKA